ncbi:MAG: hypothetical protein K1X89_30335 [Myxococcaceae bacterium]|nr:hypothetical protein [Myxococcaceae bacterium]
MKVDQLLAEARAADIAPPPNARARVLERLSTARPARTSPWLALAGVTAAALGGFVTWNMLRAPSAPAPTEVAATDDGVTVEPGAQVTPTARGLAIAAGRVRLSSRATLQLEVLGRTVECSAATLVVEAAPARATLEVTSGSITVIEEGERVVRGPGRYVLTPLGPKADPWAAAQALERQGDYAGADRAYEALARGDGLLAESALVAQATLRLSHRHDAPGALAALDAAASRFPSGALEPERSLARLESLWALGRAADARDEAQGYLERFGRSAQASQVRFLRARAQEQLGALPAAEADYGALLDDPATGDDASFAFAALAARQHHQAQAQARLRSYLARFPRGQHAREAATLLKTPR